MFFSLKCGTLFELLRDENKIEQDFQRLIILLQAVQNADGNVSEDKAREVDEIISKYQVGDQTSIEDIYRIIIKKARNKKDFLDMLFEDREKEDNKKIFRVQSTYPGIELVHFCVNDNLKKKMESIKHGTYYGRSFILEIYCA